MRRCHHAQVSAQASACCNGHQSKKGTSNKAKSNMRITLLFSILSWPCESADAWVSVAAPMSTQHSRSSYCTACKSSLVRQLYTDSNADEIDMDTLLDMDIVLFSRINTTESDNQVELGAIQEDGTLAPLSAWTDEYAFDESIEFVVDEEDRFPGLTSNDVTIIKVLDERVIGYGSRQVGGG